MLNIDMRKIYNFCPIEPAPNRPIFPRRRSLLRVPGLHRDRQFRPPHQGGLYLRQYHRQRRRRHHQGSDPGGGWCVGNRRG